jgi:phosphatidylglycerophosphate synthase
MTSSATNPASTPALRIFGDCQLELWSHTPAKRLFLQFAKAGIAERSNVDSSVILLRADAVLDQPLIPLLVRSIGITLLADDGTPIAAHVHQSESGAAETHLSQGQVLPNTNAKKPADFGADFWKALRKRETPYALVVTEANKAEVEWRMFMGTYKGATDLVTKHLWPVPAFHVTRWLAPLGVTPNMVTIVALLLVFLTFWLFLEGHYGWGLVTAWTMTFLDTVDGKLARATLTSSKWGDVLDHGVDLVHPPFWYIAWALGLSAWGYVWPVETFWIVIASILGGYVLQRIMEGVAIMWLGLEIHIWRPIDTLFRQITARRNPNLVILTLFLLTGRPDWGLIAVAWWTVICLLLHAIQLAQALFAKRNGPLASWMTAKS